MQVKNVPVVTLMTFAYDVAAERFADVPEWAISEPFDVAPVPDREEMRVVPGMLADEVEEVMSRQRQHMQVVLRDRFGLVLREQNREQPFYVLTISEGGPRLTPAARGVPGGLFVSGGLLGQPRRLEAKGLAMEELTRMMSQLNLLGLPVVDETGLSGRYDVELEWSPDPSIPPPGPRGPLGSAEPSAGAEGSIFTALAEQLGIQVESRQGPVPVLVVERIEKPEEN
jgi:uncharacterized protein (TIGR03435 family)